MMFDDISLFLRIINSFSSGKYGEKVVTSFCDNNSFLFLKIFKASRQNYSAYLKMMLTNLQSVSNISRVPCSDATIVDAVLIFILY